MLIWCAYRRTGSGREECWEDLIRSSHWAPLFHHLFTQPPASHLGPLPDDSGASSLSDPEITLAEQVLEKLFSSGADRCPCSDFWLSLEHLPSLSYLIIPWDSVQESLLQEVFATEAPQYHSLADFNDCINQYGLGAVITTLPASQWLQTRHFLLRLMVHPLRVLLWIFSWLSPAGRALSLCLKNCQGRHCFYSFMYDMWHLLTFHCKASHKITTVLGER